jgi:hypothetical protein
VDLETTSENNNTSNSKELSSSTKEEIVLNKNTIELAHNRLGHISLNAIKKLIDNTKGITINLEDIDSASVSLDNCTVCIESKLTKNRNKETFASTSKPSIIRLLLSFAAYLDWEIFT